MTKVSALLVRRKQLIARGLDDPFVTTRGSNSVSGFSTVSNVFFAKKRRQDETSH